MSDKEKQDNMLAMKAMNEFAIEDDESIGYNMSTFYCILKFIKIGQHTELFSVLKPNTDRSIVLIKAFY